MPKYNVRRKAQLGLDIREGGIAIPIANNMFYIDGRKHAAGGVAIGPNNKNGVEVEGGEVVEMIDSNHPSIGRQFKAGGQQQTMRVFSSVPFLRGVSPAQLVMGGANPNKVFKAQEEFKDRNRINDDGTRYEVGGEKIYIPSKSIQRQIQETGNITIGGAPTIGGLRTFGYLRGLTTARKYGAKSSLIFRAGKELIKRGTQKLVDNGKITKEVAQIPRSIYGQFVGAYGQNLSKTIGLINNMEQKRFGGSKQDDTKTAALKHLKNKFTIRGDYNGGMFGGAGAGSVIMTQPEFITDTITKRYLVPVTQTFNDAFRDARNSGQNEFMFDGKLYNTNLGNNPNNNTAGSNRTSTIIVPIEHKEVRRRKKEFGGSMIYTINGNVKNGLNLRSKAQYGLATKYLKKKNKTTEKPVDNKQKDEPKVLDIRNTAGYKIKQAAENPWIKYPVEVASYLLTGATAKGMQTGAKIANKTINKIDDILGKPRQEYLSRNVSDKTISYAANSKSSVGKTYKATSKDLNKAKKEVQNRPTINDLVEARSTVGNVPQHTTISHNPSPQNPVSTINYFDVKNTRLPNIERFGRKQMDTKTSRELDKVYRKAVGNKEPKSGFGRVPQQTTIEYTPKGESINAYDASVEFHKRVSDMLYDSYVKKYGKKGVDKAMKAERISKYEYGGRIKAENGKFLKYKNGVFTDPETGEEYEVDPEVFKMYGNTKESGVIPTADYTKGTFNARPQYYAEKRLPIAGSQSIAEKAGLARSGWSYGDSSKIDYKNYTKSKNAVDKNTNNAYISTTKPNTGESYVINPITGEWIRNGVTETSEPSVKGTTKVSSKSSSTARGRGTKVSTPKAASQSTPTIQDTLNKITADAWKASKTPKIDLSKVEMPIYNVSDLGSKESRAAKAKLNTSSTGGGTQSKGAPWIPQYNTITGRDWLGVGTNLAGHIASYFANNSLLKKAPMPTKPVSFQAAKLKTTYNINPELANIDEVAQMNLSEVGRNTSSSSTSLARKQRIMNEARDAKNKLYGQKENIETQLINLDRRNRQDVYNRNIAAYNDWLDKTYVAKSNQLLNKQRNLTNLISGIPMAVNTMLGTIETRKSTNDMIRAIAAANPNVDGRLLGIGDYYTQKQSNGRTAIYNKNHKLVKYV